MGLKTLLGIRDRNEPPEQFVRRLTSDGHGRGGYVAAVFPSLIELYDRLAELEARVRELERHR